MLSSASGSRAPVVYSTVASPSGDDTYAEGLAQLTPILPPGPSIPTPLDVRRVTSRRPAALPATSVPRWSTTSRPALPASRQ